MPHSTRTSVLLRQNENVMFLSSSSCTICMIFLLHSPTAMREVAAFDPRLDVTAGRWISVRM